MKEQTITQTPLMSVQDVRLIDVFVVAPFCFYTATYKSLPTWVRAGLVILGATTLYYNGSNYLLNRKNAI
jgi:hypothetical protein